MKKIKEMFSNFFKWLFNLMVDMIPYALMIGWFTSCAPKYFTGTGMTDPTMGFIYFGLLMLYIYSI